MSNKPSIRWSSAVILHPAYQMRLYSPPGEFIEKPREALCQSLKEKKKYSEDKGLRQFLNLDDKKSILHTNIPCYFNKRNRSWSAFFIKRDFMKDNMPLPDDKVWAVKKGLLSFTMQFVDDYEREIKRFLCDEEYLETLNESIKYLMNKYLLKFIDKILKGNKDIERNIKGVENIEREINFIKKELLEELRQSDLVVDIEKAQKTIENFTRRIEDLVKECKPEKSEKIKELIKDKEKLIKDIENTPKIIENFTEHIKDLVKGYKPETPKKIKELIIGIKEPIEDSKKKVCESLRKKLGYPDEYDPNKKEVDIYDLFLYLFLRFSSHTTWYECGIAYRILPQFKDAYGKKIIPKCWYMATIEEVHNKKLVDIILHDPDKEEDNYYIQEEGQSEEEKIPPVPKTTREYILAIRDEIYLPLFSLFNQRDDLFIEKGVIHTDRGCMEKGWWKKDVITHDTVVIPIFEIYINGIGYGRLQGVYALYREDQKALLPNNKRANEIKAKIAEYTFKTSKLSMQEISEKTFLADVMRTRKKISNKSDDIGTYKRFNHFFKYFLEIISYCQDWENIWLIKKSGQDYKVHFWWGRGQQDEGDQEEILSEWKNILEANGQEEAEAAVKKVLDLDNQKCYRLEIKDCDMFSKKDFEDCNTLLGSDKFEDCEIVLEYPKDTIFPTDDDSCFMFQLQIKERLIRIVQVAYDIWKTNMKIDDYQKVKRYIIQMSYNLYDALTGMSENLEKTIGPMDGKRQSSRLLDPKSLNDNSTKEQKLLLGYYNFFKYLKNRFKSFTLDVPGKGNKEKKSKLSYKVMIDEFNKQVLFKKYITWAAKKNDSKSYDVKLIYSEDANQEVYYDILYMFLENYIRNVVKHSNEIISNNEPIRCYLEIQEVSNHRKKLCVSIWEDSIKNILPKEFFKEHEELEDNIKERVGSRPFLIDRKGTSAMVCLADSLCETGSEIEVHPVFVVPGKGDTSTRHKVECDEGSYYYEDNNKKKKRIVPCKSTNGDDGYRLSMEYQFKMDI